jgi:hypothetical protein
MNERTYTCTCVNTCIGSVVSLVILCDASSSFCILDSTRGQRVSVAQYARPGTGSHKGGGAAQETRRWSSKLV